jgi:hypothetical protein
MSKRTSFCALVVGLMSLGSASRALSPGPMSLELLFDLRTRLATGSRSDVGLYDSSLRSRIRLGSGWSAEYYGARKSRSLLTLPSSSDFLTLQATLEKDWGSQRLQGGMIRLPFGIYDYRETYASGLIDYPMPRLDYGFNSVDWGVPGVQWTGGSPRFQIEAAGFDGDASGAWGNTNRLGGGAVRVQTYLRDLILGSSYWGGYVDISLTKRDKDGDTYTITQRRRVRLNGLDIRYTRPHLLLRGEFLFGVLGGKRMEGWYLDAYYHLPRYEKWTLAARLESLRPGAGMPYGRQVTLGVRYTLSRDWVLAVNWRHNNINAAYPYSWTPDAGAGGDFYLQVYHELLLFGY